MMTTDIKKPVLYTTIQKLPLSRFQDCLCDDDLNALIISGNPTEEELLLTWEDILDQYYQALAGDEQQYYLSLCSRVRVLQIKSYLIHFLVEVLRETYVEKFEKRLRRLVKGCNKLDITKLEEYDKELGRYLSKAASINLKVQELTKEAEVMALEKGYTNHKPTRADFQKVLITLGDFAGRDIDENTTTVFMYCERLKRYNQYVENKQLQNSARQWER